MRRAEGSAGVRLLECINPMKNKWRVRWDVQETDNYNVTYMEHDFDHKPTVDEVKSTVIGWYNSQIDGDIVSGFRYEENMVWLSQENQFNYKAAYDLAMQTAGASLPVRFKFGMDEAPVYKIFTTLDCLTDFYVKAMAHVQDNLEEGWRKKDAIDLSIYE